MFIKKFSLKIFSFAFILPHLKVNSSFSCYCTTVFFIDHFRRKEWDRRHNVIDISVRSSERSGVLRKHKGNDSTVRIHVVR